MCHLNNSPYFSSCHSRTPPPTRATVAILYEHSHCQSSPPSKPGVRVRNNRDEGNQPPPPNFSTIREHNRRNPRRRSSSSSTWNMPTLAWNGNPNIENLFPNPAPLLDLDSSQQKTLIRRGGGRRRGEGDDGVVVVI
ncbi:hypothetical protein Droror1_Dr00000035 [Drosera rotundifolia]